jgi:uncharacterized protein (TIGR02444 family)
MGLRADRFSSSLWAFATEFYGRPGVEPALLSLQDEHGLDIPVLITMIYCGRRGLALSEDRVSALSALAAIWQAKAIAPLRAARRALKPENRTEVDPDQEALRQQIKDAELAAERLLLARLEALLPLQATVEPVRAIDVNLSNYLSTFAQNSEFLDLISVLKHA